MSDLWKILTNLFKAQNKSEIPSVSPPIDTPPEVSKVEESSTPQPIQTPTPQAAVVVTPTVEKLKSTATATSTNLPKAKTRSEATLRYGKIVAAGGKLVWSGEAAWMGMFVMPAGFEHIINTASDKPLTKIYCNKDMHAPLKLALQNLLDRGLAKEFKTFDGCFMLRMVRGTTDALSTHSYGLAVDLNASENALGQEPRLSPEFVKCFTDVGFAWGGSFKRKDGMHFSFCWE